ncbi:MAG: 23S rRNA (adenine(2503)-C(2))-methyltransferase RlmN [Lachnospiraceae bacterium]|nr:23S rRNA (adenine(2503)-C(2))-methyltransferase RlmN [Lachnospiraceae bacterium]
MTDIKSLMPAELQAEMEKIGEKKFRAGQIYSWLHEKLADDFDEMSNLPKSLRERLHAEYELVSLELLEVQTSKLDGTAKFLFRLSDGNVIESVLMRYHYGNSVCVSSQAGCRMGCRFCASTLGGLSRNLRASEILDQVYQIQKWSKERVHSVVVMGSGEPLDNYDALLRFIRLLTTEGGLHISQRNVTVSTCGIVPMMRRLADEELQITLALSLHAPSQEKRLQLMPVAKRYELPEVLDACRYYFEKTGRRVTFEYSLVGGVNDAPEDARALAALLGDMNCHVNLIPVNPVAERGLTGPKRGTVLNFKEILEKSGKHVTIRREMGRDIDGACGQLRRRYLEK